MSIWSDIEDRSLGNAVRKEDYSLLYERGVLEQIYKDTYKNMTYVIAAKDFPYIEIISDLDISIFSGSSQVILTDDGKVYELQREVMSNCVHFYYNCNKKGDYIPGVQDGHQYCLNELKRLAEEFIDIILKAEDNLFDTI